MKHFQLWGYEAGESVVKDLASLAAVALFAAGLAAIALAAS